MAEWTPMLLLPNLGIKDCIGDDDIMLTSVIDPRAGAAAVAQPSLGKFFERFTDAFGTPITPSALIIRDGTPYGYKDLSAIAGFRDIIAVSTILAGRALHLTHGGSLQRPIWGDTFQFYPWMVNRYGDQLIGNTAAMFGTHDVARFAGQTTPGLPQYKLSEFDVDAPLFQELLRRWHRRNGDGDALWEDRALFRSLNLAFHAMAIPAGIEHSFYDVGRLLTLWVSAFEVLLHPGPGGSVGETQVLDHLDRVMWYASDLKNKSHAVRVGKVSVDRTWAAYFMHLIYGLRNGFMHGNDVQPKDMAVQNDVSLFQLASSLYRMALAEFLKLRQPSNGDADDDGEFDPREFGKLVAEIMFWRDPQERHERAILKAAGLPDDD